MQTIRWGIIGCGDVTEVKSGPALQKARGSALVAVMRRTASLAQDYAQRHQVPRWYDDAQQLINDPEVDAVYIATPPSSHKQYTLMCALARKPVYVEKPMALNVEECRTMIRACEETATPLFVAYYRRALPRFLKIRELLAAGAIGEVRCVNIRLYQPIVASKSGTVSWRVDPQISGGGLFVDLASHMLDFLDYLLGPIIAAQGLASNQTAQSVTEDMVSAIFKFESGVHGSGSWCFGAAQHYDFTEIIGTVGKIAYATFDTSPVVLTTADGSTEFPLANPSHVQQPLIQTVVDHLNGESSCPSMGVSAVRTNWVMEQILKGYYRK